MSVRSHSKPLIVTDSSSSTSTVCSLYIFSVVFVNRLQCSIQPCSAVAASFSISSSWPRDHLERSVSCDCLVHVCVLSSISCGETGSGKR